MQTHVVPAELQHGPDQGELFVDLLALQVGEDLLEAVADAVHGHVAAEDDAEGEHVEEDAALHGQLLVAGRRLLLRHAVLEGGVVKVHLVNLQGSAKGFSGGGMKNKRQFEFPGRCGETPSEGILDLFQAKDKLFVFAQTFILGCLLQRYDAVYEVQSSTGCKHSKTYLHQLSFFSCFFLRF